jgi:translation initiation factor IF-2
VQPPIGIPLPKSASQQPVKAKPEEETPVETKQEPKQEPKAESIKTADVETAIAQPTPEVKTEPTAVGIKKIASSVPAEMKAEIEAEERRAAQAAATQRREAPRPAPTQRQEPHRPASSSQQGQRPEGSSQQGQRPAGTGYQGQRPAGQSQQGQRPAGSSQQGQRPAGTGYQGQGQQGQRPPSARPDYAKDRASGAPMPPRQKKPDAPGAAPVLPVKKGKKDKPEDKRDKPDVKRDPKKKSPYTPRSMEKPTLKKPRKQKQAQPVEEENRINLEELAPGTKIVNVPITVKGFSEQIEKTTSEIIMALMKLGIMANVNQNLDEDTVVLLGEELGIVVAVDKVEEQAIEEGLELHEDEEEDLKPRPPIITVMGHVDHGKTSLLDAIRKTNVAAGESGGITQHIGASEVTINGQKIVFLDTPGHEAFTAMRARGAHVTDIAVLVVAADDSVKPQTLESISHAKAAGVPIIVAINKIDKEGANPDRVKQDLANLPENKILVEEYGGDTICVPVSAKTGTGIVTLLEMILLQAEVLELRANPARLAMGTVIEARLDKAKGPVTTLLVTNGTLHSGMSIVAGTCHGKIRAMTNFKGEKIRKAGPATAVEILGLTEVPEAGDEFNALKDDKTAREIAEQRRIKLREEVMVRNSSVTLEQLFSQIQAGEIKELNLILKGDVQGSVGALTQSLEKLQTENVKVRIIHAGVGTVTESDIMLASTTNAIIIGFNVRPSTNITAMAEREKVEIRTYRVIYEIIDDIEAALKGMLDPIFKEVVMGKIEIRETFKVPGIGNIGGAYVLEGKVQRNAQIRLVRDGIVIHEGKISSLKRFKDDAKEVAQGYECGIGIENYNDIKEGDIIEAFKMEEIERK